LFAGIAFMELADYNNALIMLETGKSFAIGDGGVKIDFKLSLAELFYKMGEYTESDKVFEEILTVEPNNALALNNYAYFLSKRKSRLTDAENMVQKAIELEGGNASFYDTYGWVLFNKAEYEKAIEKFDLALEMDGENAEILEHKGDAFYKKGDSTKALELWKLAETKGGNSKILLKKINDKKYYEE
jgi:Tfp pilus assembly protein PilF